MPYRQQVQRFLRRVVVQRRLTYADVANRTGLVDRTVERFLEGETFDDRTADKIALGLRVNLRIEGSDLPDTPMEELLTGLPLWRLRGSSEWWAKIGDVAVWLGVDRSTPHLRVLRGLRAGRLERADVRGSVRDADAMLSDARHCLTSSPRGCTMLSARACLWLLLTGESRVADRSLDTVIEEGVQCLRGGPR